MIEIGIDGSGHVCGWNSAAEAMSGFARDEVLGWHFVRDLLGTSSKNPVTQMICCAWMGQTTPHFTVPFYTKTGQRIDLLLFSMLRWSETRNAHDVILSGALHTSDASKRLSVDRNGCIIDWGDEVHTMTGFSPDEVLGLSFADDIVASELCNLADEKVSQALAGKKVPEFGISVISKSTVKKSFRVQVDPSCIDERIVGASLTLTAESSENEAADAKNGWTAAQPSDFLAVDAADRMVLIGMNEDGRVCDWNNGAEAMSGYDRSEALGQRFVSAFFEPGCQDLVHEKICRAWMGGSTGHGKVPFRTKSGQLVELLLSALLRWSKARKAHYIVLAGRLNTSYATRSISVDRSGCITDWGDDVTAMTGLCLDEVLGLSLVADIITASLRDLALKKLSQVLAGEGVGEFYLPILSRFAAKKLYQVRVDRYSIDHRIVGAILVLAESKEKMAGYEDSVSTCTPRTTDTLPTFGTPTVDFDNTSGLWDSRMPCLRCMPWTTDTLPSFSTSTVDFDNTPSF